MEQIVSLAPEIDRLVWTVNRWAERDHGPSLQRTAERIGLEEPGHIDHFADWLTTIGITRDVGTRRLPYAASGSVEQWFDALEHARLVDETGGVYTAAPSLVPLAEALLAARAAAARDHWSAPIELVPSLTGTAERLTAATPDRFVVAASHRRIPAFDDPLLTLHTRFVTLRYIRAHAHVEAWSEESLSAPEIWALTALWKGGDPGPGLASIESKGLARLGVLTDTGLDLRIRIEADTNARLDPIFGSIDRGELDDFVEAVRNIEGSPP